MKYHCRDFQNMVQPFLLRELPDPELKAFLEHIKTCKRCADELETYFIVDYSLRYLDNDTTHSDDIQELLAERILEEEHDLKLRHLIRVAVPAGLLALLGVTVILILKEAVPELMEPIFSHVRFLIREFWRVK